MKKKLNFLTSSVLVAITLSAPCEIHGMERHLADERQQVPRIQLREDEELVNRQNVIRIIRNHERNNANLLRSSQGQDIVVFLGNTGSGKSTLINYLSDIRLIGDRFGRITLLNPNNPRAMAIGHGGAPGTFLPKFIQAGNLLLYDLPGFRGTGGTATNLVNAYFIKHIIERASTVKLVFVAGFDQITADRGAGFTELLNRVERFIPQEGIDIRNVSSLIITKKLRHIDLNAYLQQPENRGLRNNIPIPLNRIISMSAPNHGPNIENPINRIDPGERNPILEVIRNQTVGIRIENINTDIVYRIDDAVAISNIYREEIEEIATRIITFYTRQEYERTQREDARILIQNYRTLALRNFEISEIVQVLKDITPQQYQEARLDMQNIVVDKLFEQQRLYNQGHGIVARHRVHIPWDFCQELTVHLVRIGLTVAERILLKYYLDRYVFRG
jgi:energy-coupling factor transporter ATP-binding protein EcfA2